MDVFRGQPWTFFDDKPDPGQISIFPIPYTQTRPQVQVVINPKWLEIVQHFYLKYVKKI